MTDAQFESCIVQITQGNREGLRLIYEAYIGYIYATVFSVLKNKENAEDVSTDFFLKLWSIAGSYQPGNGHRGWIARIAHNMAIDFLRKNRREQLSDRMEQVSSESEEDGKGIIPVDTKSCVEEEVVADLSLKETLAMLNEKEREVINLKIIGDLTFKEIAAMLKEPMGTITWRYQSAIKKLRRCGYE